MTLSPKFIQESPRRRKQYYNPKLDPKVAEQEYDEPGGPLFNCNAFGDTNLISSLDENGWHYPALDIDIPCRYVPSSTEGHGHLYFDTVRLNWSEYIELMQALVKAHIIQESYFKHCLDRGQSLLRKPGIVKHPLKEKS